MNKYLLLKVLLFVNFLLLLDFQPGVCAGNESNSVKENIRILQETKACPGCDLSGSELNRMDLSGANLQGADLTGAKLYLVNFSGANLQNAHLQRASLGGADLAGADLRGADLRGAELNGAYLEGAKFDSEFVGTKPYDEESVSKIEKKSNVNDAEQVKENGPVPADKNEKRGANVQETDTDQRRETSVSPSVKADEPIKDILVSANLQSSDDTRGQIDPEKKEDFARISKKDSKDAAGRIKDRAQGNDVEIKDGIPESVKSNTKASVEMPSDTKSPPMTGATRDHEPGPQSVENENTQNMTTEKTSTETVAPRTPSGGDRTLVEKDQMKETRADKVEISKTEALQSDKIPSDKASDLKRLLETKKCYRCNLAGIDVSDKNLSEADLEGANLTGSNLEKTDLTKAVLKGAVLVNANLKKANLKGADLYKADLSGADLTDANMENTKVDGTLFIGAIGR